MVISSFVEVILHFVICLWVANVVIGLKLIKYIWCINYKGKCHYQRCWNGIVIYNDLAYLAGMTQRRAWLKQKMRTPGQTASKVTEFLYELWFLLFMIRFVLGWRKHRRDVMKSIYPVPPTPKKQSENLWELNKRKQSTLPL